MPIIDFPRTQSVYPPADTLSFPVILDGALVSAEISAEALRKHFGAASSRGLELIRAFRENRPAIEEIARQKLVEKLVAGRALFVTGDF